MRIDEYTNMFALEDRFWWYRGIHDLILGYLRKRPASRLSILDAGCGTGKLMTLLAPLGEVAGIDASEQAIQYCRERGLLAVEIVDLNRGRPPGRSTTSSPASTSSVTRACAISVPSSTSFSGAFGRAESSF